MPAMRGSIKTVVISMSGSLRRNEGNEMFRFDAHLLEEAERVAYAIVLHIKNLLYVADIDQELRAIRAGQMRAQHDLLSGTW